MIGGRVAGKTFPEKSFPRTPFKRLGTRVRDMADLEFYRFGSAVQGSVRSTFGDPDLRSPSGFDSGLSPSAQDDTRGGSGVPRSVRSAIGDPDLRSPCGFDFGLSPSAQDDTKSRM